MLLVELVKLVMIGKLLATKKENNELLSATNQLKLKAVDEKKYLSDTFDYDDIIEIAKNFLSK